MKFVIHDNTHFKRKRSQNSARSLNCSEWKSALKYRTKIPKYDANMGDKWTDYLIDKNF